MTSYKNTLVAAGFALAISVAATGVSTASAATKSERANGFRLQGTIVSVERSTRTVVVKEDGTNAAVRVHVPEGAAIGISKTALFSEQSSVGIELARRGQKVNMRVAASAEPALASAR